MPIFPKTNVAGQDHHASYDVIYIYTLIYIYIYTHICIHIYIYMIYVCITHKDMCIYMCIYTYTYIHTYIYIYIYTIIMMIIMILISIPLMTDFYRRGKNSIAGEGFCNFNINMQQSNKMIPLR